MQNRLRFQWLISPMIGYSTINIPDILGARGFMSLQQCPCNVLFTKRKFRRKSAVLPIKKFPFLVLHRNTITMLQHLFIHSSLHYLSSGRLREVKNKGKFQTFSSKEVPYMRFDLERFGILKNWLLRRTGRNWRFDCNSILICIDLLVWNSF